MTLIVKFKAKFQYAFVTFFVVYGTLEKKRATIKKRNIFVSKDFEMFKNVRFLKTVSRKIDKKKVCRVIAVT